MRGRFHIGILCCGVCLAFIVLALSALMGTWGVMVVGGLILVASFIVAEILDRKVEVDTNG